MKFCTLASSSSGNSTLVSAGKTNILIDAGISMRRITAALGQLGLCPTDLTGILVTHEHTDHVCGLKMLTKHYGIPVYTGRVVAEDLVQMLPELADVITPFTAGVDFALGDLEIHSFHTPHDVPESVGYRITDGKSVFAYATDLGTVTQEVYANIQGADAIVAEANHDLEMLKNGPYPYPLKKRILSDHGHLSNALSGKFCAALGESGTKKILLAHLSKHNNTPELAYHTVSETMESKGVGVGRDVTLHVAPADWASALYTV